MKEMKETKVCIKCSEEKLATDKFFSRNGKYLRTECKTCQSGYHKENYKQNKETIDESNRIYRYANKEKMATANRNWYLKNVEEITIKIKKYQNSHREKINKQKREYSRTAQGRAVEANKRARRKLKTKDQEISKEDWLLVMESCDWKCFYCDCKLDDGNRTIDHFVPLCKNGDHSIFNLLPACKPCNCSKQGFFYYEWAKKKAIRINNS